MRIILKPIGAICLLVGIAVLCFTAFFAKGATKRPQAEDKASAAVPSRIYPPDGSLVLTDDPWQWNLITPSEKFATLDERKDAAAPGGKGKLAFHVRERSTKEPEWAVFVQRAISEPMARGSKVVVQFYGRSSSRGSLTVLLDQGGSTELGLAGTTSADLTTSVHFGPQWKDFSFTVQTGSDYPADQAKLRFQPTRDAGEFELANITVRDFGPASKNAETK